MTTYYVTKYALTKGILEVEAAESLGCGVIRGRIWAHGFQASFGPKEWHEGVGDAEARVMEMRDKEIKKLETRLVQLKQIEPPIRVTRALRGERP